MSLFPELDFVDYVEDLTCTHCREVVPFAIADKNPDTSTCRNCFRSQFPENRSALQVLDVLDVLLEELKEQKERKMSQKDMHELYGAASKY